MNKLIKLSSNHYIIVSDSEIKEGNWFYNPKYQEIGINYNPDGCFKITHSTQPLEKDISYSGSPERPVLGYWEIKQITLSEVEEAVNGYNYHTLAKEACIKYGIEIDFVHPYTLFIEGFKAHQEISKDKLFTVQDMEKAMTFMYWFCQDVTNEYLEHNFNIKNAGDLNTNQAITAYIQSLLPKTEWDIEFDEQGKIKLI